MTVHAIGQNIISDFCFARSMIFSCYKICYGLNVHVFVQSCAIYIYSCNITYKRYMLLCTERSLCSQFLGNLSEEYYLHILNSREYFDYLRSK